MRYYSCAVFKSRITIFVIFNNHDGWRISFSCDLFLVIENWNISVINIQINCKN